MIRDWWADQGLYVAPALTLLLFLGIFLGMLFWIFRPGAREYYRRGANLPLEEDKHPIDKGAVKAPMENRHA